MLPLRPVALSLFLCVAVQVAAGQPADSVNPAAPPDQPAEKKLDRAALEAAFSQMMSGATLEGSFTTTAGGFDPTQFAREKYTLGDVKKLDNGYWLIPARIQYGEHDVTIPLMLPVRWAGDTPMIVVDEVNLPGFGAVSARVMFFADHYAGYWKHGDKGGHLFGVISRDEAPAADKPAAAAKTKQQRPSRNAPTGQQPE